MKFKVKKFVTLVSVASVALASLSLLKVAAEDDPIITASDRNDELRINVAFVPKHPNFCDGVSLVVQYVDAHTNECFNDPPPVALTPTDEAPVVWQATKVRDGARFFTVQFAKGTNPTTVLTVPTSIGGAQYKLDVQVVAWQRPERDASEGVESEYLRLRCLQYDVRYLAMGVPLLDDTEARRPRVDKSWGFSAAAILCDPTDHQEVTEYVVPPGTAEMG
jgi:hypothetical protein